MNLAVSLQVLSNLLCQTSNAFQEDGKGKRNDPFYKCKSTIFSYKANHFSQKIMGIQDFGVIMNYLQIFFTNKWHKKTCPQEVQLAFGIVLKKVAELLYIKFYAIFAPRRQIIKRKRQDKR